MLRTPTSPAPFSKEMLFNLGFFFVVFGDRVTKCLDDGAAAGLDPNERSHYSRNCANR